MPRGRAALECPHATALLPTASSCRLGEAAAGAQAPQSHQPCETREELLAPTLGLAQSWLLCEF